MATQSKSSKPRKTPNQTRNGRPRYTSFNLSKLTELLDKSNRPRDRRKIQNRINVLIKQQG